MTVPFERDFDPGDDFPSVVMDALQRMLTAGLAAAPVPIRIKPGAANTLQVPAGSGQDAVGIPVDGHWRWIETTAEQAGSGSAELKDVWACTAASVYDPGSPGETDSTDRSFVLRVTTSGAAAPGGFAHTRKIAVAVWDGAKFIAVAPVVGGVAGATDKTSGKSIVTAAETRSSNAYGVLGTADRVQGIVLPADCLLEIYFQALWQCDSAAAGNARAAVFIGANQLKVGENEGAPQTQAAAGFGQRYRNLHTAPIGLISYDANTTDATDVTTGQVIGSLATAWPVEIGGTLRLIGNGALGATNAVGANVPLGGPVTVFAAAGTYDVSVQFKTSAGVVSVKNRKLWVRVLPFS